MEVKINQNDKTIEAAVSGRIDTTTADQFSKDIAPLMEAEGAQISIDCSALEYTSSQGLRSFLLLQKCANTKGSSLVLTGMRPEVKEVFDITGFSTIIKIL